MAGNDASPTRYPQRVRASTNRARGNYSTDWEEGETDDITMTETPKPRGRPPKTPSIAASKGDAGNNKTGNDPLSAILSAIEKIKASNEGLKSSIEELQASNKELKASNEELKIGNAELRDQLSETKKELAETKAQLADAMSAIGSISGIGSEGKPSEAGTPASGSQPQSYASTLTRSINPSSSASQPANKAATSNPANIICCTIDTSRVDEKEKNLVQLGAIRQAIEKEMRTTENQENWRCAAVSKDPRNPDRIRVTCRNEAELQRVKRAAQTISVTGTRVLRDQLYPVKLDNANRTAVFDQEWNVREGAMEALGKENNVHIAKIAWLSKKDIPKTYGSMVVYVTKSGEAAQLLEDQFFHINGESAYTRFFDQRHSPQQCYRCQGLGHKAFSCTKPQTYAKCAEQGHHHKDCQAIIPKCALCGGPHEAFSRNCETLHTRHHA
jgi:hypothetical protein